MLELALDAGAARETIVFGLQPEGRGHVAFASRSNLGDHFAVTFAIDASHT